MHHRISTKGCMMRDGTHNRRDLGGVRQFHRQAIRKAPLLQLQVQPHEVQFIAETREIPLTGIQQAAQQIGQLHHHGLLRPSDPTLYIRGWCAAG